MKPISIQTSQPLDYQEVKHLKVNSSKKKYENQTLFSFQTTSGVVTTSLEKLSLQAGVLPSASQYPQAVAQALEASVQLQKKARLLTGREAWTQYLPSIKKTIYIAAEQGLKKGATTAREIEMPVGNTPLWLHAKDTGQHIEVLGLFGKTLGKGAIGSASTVMNLLDGADSTIDKPVVKVFHQHKIHDSLPDDEKQLFERNNRNYAKSFNAEVRVNEYLAQKLAKMPAEAKRFFAPGSHLGNKFITFPYMPGCELVSYISKNPNLPIQKKKEIANQILEAVNHLHQMDIYHVDLHFGNVMIDVDPQGKFQIKLFDFGGSQAIDLIDESEHLDIGWLVHYDKRLFEHYKWSMDNKNKEALRMTLQEIDSQSIALELLNWFSGVSVTTHKDRSKIDQTIDVLKQPEFKDPLFQKLVDIAFNEGNSADLFSKRFDLSLESIV